MVQQIFRVFLILLGVLGGGLIWGLLCLRVNRDVRRRGLERADRWYWTALTMALGPVGAIIYLLSRAMEPWFRLEPLIEAGNIIRGETFPKPGSVEAAEPGLQTQPAVVQTVSAKSRSSVVETQPVAPIPQPGGYLLQVIEGPDAGLTYPLDVLPVRIGRGPEVQVRLDRDRTVSRKHADLFEEDSLIHIRDLMSMQGVRVNGLTVLEQVLFPGDRIQIGRSVLQLTIGTQRFR